MMCKIHKFFFPANVRKMLLKSVRLGLFYERLLPDFTTVILLFYFPHMVDDPGPTLPAEKVKKKRMRTRGAPRVTKVGAAKICRNIVKEAKEGRET